MKRIGRGAVALLAIAAAQFAAVTAAHATTGGPWDRDTVFAAVTGFRYGGDGGVAAISPNGGYNWLQNGTATDVAVGSDGTVYWVNCNGAVGEYVPGSGSSTLFNIGGCATSIAVLPSGHLLIEAGSLQDCTVAGSCTTVSTAVSNTSGLALDGEGDVYVMDGSEDLALLLADGNYVRTQGVLSGLYVRMDHSGDLLAGSPGGSVKRWHPNNGAVTTYSTGYYTQGAAIDADGNVYGSALKDSPSTEDEVVEFPAGGGGPNDIADFLDEPAGLATYPVVGPPSRTASSVTLQAEPSSPVTTLQTVTLTATVDGGSATNGLVQFASGGQPLGDAVPVSGGTASTTTTLPAGNADAITATYLGSTTEDPSQSDPLSYEVDTIDTTTTLTTTNYHRVHQNRTVHVTATVDSGGNGTPTGYVDFMIGKNEVDSEPLDGTGSASASLSVPVRKFAVTATYEGDGTYGESTSNALWFTPIPPYTPTVNTDVHYGASSPNGHQNVRLDVRVRGVTGQPVPTGTISTDDSRFTCTALTPHAASATASCVAHSLPPAEYDVTITYSGDSVYATADDNQFFYVGG
jgi:hypothetical protein